MTSDRDRALDDMLDTILDAVPAEIRDGSSGRRLRVLARELAEALVASDNHVQETGSFDDDVLKRINQAAEQIHELDEEFSLSDVESTWRSRRTAYCFNTWNFFARLGGRADHESKWDGEVWKNWNNLVRCHPKFYLAPQPQGEDGHADAAFEPVRRAVAGAETLRVVAGGHAFNESASTGGREGGRRGTLLCLDAYRGWRVIATEEAADRYGLEPESPNTLVRVHSGIRLRDFNEDMWEAGLAFPVCGSTDTQSLGGLLASDLHGSGRRHGYLAEVVREVRVVRADGRMITWLRGPSGWTTDEPQPRCSRRLPIAGALGMLGVVVELVVELEPAFCLEKNSYFAARAEIEEKLEDLVASHDHVNLFYPCGGRSVRTIQVNTLDRTDRRPTWLSGLTRFAGEMGDHALASFTPGLMFGMAERDPERDFMIRMVNRAKPNVLASPAAFTRRLYYLHDEVEYAFPMPVARDAIRATVDLLRDEELHSIVELRFTPESAQSWIGPGRAADGHGGAVWFGLATAIGEHSRARIMQVFEKFDRAMQPFGGRPHLGKQTMKVASEMEALYGRDWQAFQSLRQEFDPAGKFLPAANPFLQKLFNPGSGVD